MNEKFTPYECVSLLRIRGTVSASKARNMEEENLKTFRNFPWENEFFILNDDDIVAWLGYRTAEQVFVFIQPANPTIQHDV